MSAASRIVLIAAAAGLAASIGLLWLSDVALGVPGEWTWLRIPSSETTVWGCLVAAVTAGVYLSCVDIGSRFAGSESRSTRAAYLFILMEVGFVWLFLLQVSVPGVAGLPKSHPVLFNWGSSGYFWQARYEVADTREFLAGYEDLVAQGDYLHIGTHPPGLTLLFRGLLDLFETSPTLTDVVLATEPESCREAAGAIRLTNQAAGRAFTRTDEAVLWFAALLANAATAATVVPLFVLLAEFVDRRTAWFAAAFWPLVPGVAVFLPKADAVFPLFSILGPCLWLVGWRKRSFVLCTVSGLTLFGGMLLSLAIAPIAVLTGLATVFGELRARSRPVPPPLDPKAEQIVVAIDGRAGPALFDPPPATRKSWFVNVTAAAVGFFVPLFLLWWGCDLNLPKIWAQNVTNHAAFYDHFTRTWWKWVLVNPFEAALAAGVPLAITALIGGFRSRRTRLFPLVVATALVWGLLWISGKNSGEAARLWLLFQPWLVVAASAALVDQRAAGFSPAERATGFNSAAHQRTVWLAVLALQAVACIATVTRVDGFELSQL